MHKYSYDRTIYQHHSHEQLKGKNVYYNEGLEKLDDVKKIFQIIPEIGTFIHSTCGESFIAPVIRFYKPTIRVTDKHCQLKWWAISVYEEKRNKDVDVIVE